MDLLQKILECKEEEVDSIVQTAIDEANANATKVEYLGFNNGLSSKPFKGFIPLETRIRFSNLGPESYGMQTTDFIFEFSYWAREKQINNKGALLSSLVNFCDHYFGWPDSKKSREDFFDAKLQTAKNEEEYWAILENSKLGDFKGKKVAMCTERGALVQQILSVFGTESYYCMGCCDKSNQDAHCFNVVKGKDNFAVFDCSMPVTKYKEDGSVRGYYPFVGILTNEEFSDFLEKGMIKSFDDYDLIKSNQQKKIGTRKYVVGQIEIKKEIVNDNETKTSA